MSGAPNKATPVFGGWGPAPPGHEPAPVPAPALHTPVPPNTSPVLLSSVSPPQAIFGGA